LTREGLTNDNARRVRDVRQETIGQRVRRLRLEQWLSQRELSRPGVSYAYLSRIEAGQRTPSLKALRLLAERLGVTAEYLETGEPIPRANLRELRVSDAEIELRLARDLAKAEAVFREEAADAANEPALIARAKADLGFLVLRRGETDPAIELLEAAAESGHLLPETRPDLYETLGRAYVAAGRTVTAVALFERCLQEVQERLPDDAALVARFGTSLAAAHSMLGATERARQALTAATEAALAAPTPHLRASTYWVEGVNAWMGGDSETGLTYMRRAIGLLEAGEDTAQLARAHIVAAGMLNLDGRFEEADTHLARAEQLLAPGGDPIDIGVLRSEEAKIAADRGDAEQALAHAQEAAALLGDDADYRSNAWHALAVAHAAAGEVKEAERYFKLALDDLTTKRQFREASQVARRWGALLRDTGRAEEAYKLVEQAMLLAVRNLGSETARARDAS
jgi:tetratricopeptide (TPR) repeat protein